MAFKEEGFPYAATIKADGGYDAPWLVIRANTDEELHDRIEALTNKTLTAIGRAAASLKAGHNMGKHLGAEAVTEEPAEKPAPKRRAPAKKAPAKKAEEPKPEPEAEPEKVEEAKPAPKRKAPAKKAGGPPKPKWTT